MTISRLVKPTTDFLKAMPTARGGQALSVAPSFSTAANTTHQLPDLPYDHAALEPVVSGNIMQLHHKMHHQTYVNNLNVALEKLAEAEHKGDVDAMIALQGAINFNGGGHINHSIFWQNLAPQSQGGGQAPTGALADAINAEFGSFDNFVSKFNASTVAIQGSGWGWLGYDKGSGRVKIASRANQDPLSATGLVPLLGVDVWEHAYYLDYKNKRADYLNEIWKVVNWADVAKRFENAK